MLGRTLILKTAAWKPIESLVRKSFLFRPLVKRFIAGDTVEDGIAAAQLLIDQGFRISLDYLGENTKSEAEARAAIDVYKQMLVKIEEANCNRSIDSKAFCSVNGELTPIETTNISIKLTQCGLDQGSEFATNNFKEVLELARKLNTFVRVDMESSAYTAKTIEILTQVHAEYKNCGTVLQSYLYRTPEDITIVNEHKMRTRLVKGAYLEPASVSHQEKSKVDEMYIEGAKHLLTSGNFPAFATHDETIVNEIIKFVTEKEISRDKFEFQMLYGIRRDLQDRLRNEGFNVRVYIPLGDSWYPYFTRRLAERPANAFFILKSLFRR